MDTLYACTLYLLKRSLFQTFTMRGSGTEPKLKYYLEVVGKGAKGQEEARTLLERMKNAVFATILRQEEYGLVSPSN